ncbi:XRE family transcriptional regulator [Streptomyces sp. RKND-216]|uniref:helix-turn-helix domain-containing protein n=1 Tax=Streptomyces sp. RKND-216 TaxID=2562581 RepID=UPI00109DD7D2|nr:helix-turn-helix transcriptional regulator [Streptomyces sp. RKND-216]THA25994.1 XRE family transcriptional regulator [Streptomyces sp. RKND-216]
MPEHTTAKASARQVLASELARLREEAGHSLGDLADLTTFDRSYLHKLETGAKLGSTQVMAALDGVYGTDRHLQLLWELAKDDAFRDRYKRFMEREREATVRYSYSPATIPGLLQTESYARELLTSARPTDEQDVEEQVAARLGRQHLLHEGPSPLPFRALIDESVLRRPTSDPTTWREQLEALLTATERAHITLQVVPLSVGLHCLVGTSLTLLWLPDGTTVAYIESGYAGELTEDVTEVERLRLAYDHLRDHALSPTQSVAFVRDLVKDVPDA